MKNKEIIQMWTDGACSGNPGNGGWGVLIKLVDGNQIKLSGHEQFTTNNRMEMLAVIEGLKYLKNYSSVIIHTDSKYVLEGITNWITNWKQNNWKSSNKKDVKNKDLWIELDALVNKFKIEWKWVKGHSGNVENDIADLLATTAIKEN
tara:strand:- start:3622 stop:4065 length:444 start_codon:yes stop_codon:yes gene_type:complete